MEAAGRFVSALSPADRVGLVAFPGASPAIDFTSNHGVVQNALAGLSGLADTFPSTSRLGISEAMAIVQGDRTMLNVVTERECGRRRRDSGGPGAPRAAAPAARRRWLRARRAA